ncbi:hypothetical protein DFP72DRAFT_815521, partial [Ephemerocybe angulata]
EEFDEDSDDEDLSPQEKEAKFEAFKTQTRVQWAKEVEGNRRVGGLRTQQGLVRFWEEFISIKLAAKEVKDKIVDEHSLLLFISWNASRPKRSPRGHEIPGTFIGASQIKKHFFSALRIRKDQEALNPRIRDERRATSDVVWNAVKCAMDKAVKRVRSGMGGRPEDDADDIVHNTFLDHVSDDDLWRIGCGFLMHRNLRSVVNGHFAFCEQLATGNRGDDVRSLRLCEMQPYDMPHPNNVQVIKSVLGLQGEEKAGLKGMQSKVNPVYSVLIAHKYAERCPLAALAILCHYYFDVLNTIENEEIDWKWNKSWRTVRLFYCGKNPKKPMPEQTLFNLWAAAQDKAEVKSRLKQHFARHILPYLQRQLGVPPDETSRMGWKRGQSYYDTYAPALPKSAILAAHGFKACEPYNPVWTNVRVPEQFLALVCPMAESIAESVRGEENKQGTTYFWDMIASLRPYLFQSAAVIFKMCPKSPLFKLPALANPDVQAWMKTTFQDELTLCEARAGNAFAIGNVENAMSTSALSSANSLTSFEIQQLRAAVTEQSMAIVRLEAVFGRRTEFLSPTKGGFSMDVYEARTYHLLQNQRRTGMSSGIGLGAIGFPPPRPPSTPIRTKVTAVNEDESIYTTSESGLRAYVNDSPSDPEKARVPTQVDLVLPPAEAFARPGMCEIVLFPPTLGRHGVTWAEVFEKIKQPKQLWKIYEPAKTLDSYEHVDALWSVFTVGEAVYDAAGNRTGMKPPLVLLEETFPKGGWRSGAPSSWRKMWQRFREIPEWIQMKSHERGVPPQEVINELEEIREEKKVGLNGLVKIVKGMHEDEVEAKARKCLEEGGITESAESGNENGREGVQPRKRRAKPRAPRKRVKVVK